jgi:RNA polymerase sigma-70 factor (ECF subfamily)
MKGMGEETPLPEREAMTALEEGDQKRALAVLMDAYGTPLYRYCRQMVSDPDMAEEAHQMTFVQAYEGLDRFEGHSSMRAWLYGIARHRCLDLAKVTRRRVRRFPAPGELPEKAAPEQSAEDAVATQQLTVALEHCLQELRPKIRQALLLRYFEELSYPEMAEICDEQPATLQARVARAMPVLRACLEKLGVAA